MMATKSNVVAPSLSLEKMDDARIENPAETKKREVYLDQYNHDDDDDFYPRSSSTRKATTTTKTPKSCMLVLMGFLVLLCFWAYLDIVQEDQASVVVDDLSMFVQVHSSSRRRRRDGSSRRASSKDDEEMEEKNEDFSVYVNITEIIGEMGEKDKERKTSALPRTSKREYNQLDPNKRYVMYSPSGGFNNQLICLLSAIHLAKSTNRSLIVPPNGMHSSMYWSYYSLKQEETVPMDHSLDFEYMEQAIGVEMIPLNTTLKAFHKSYLGGTKSSTDILNLMRIKFRGGLKHANSVYMNSMIKRTAQSDKHIVWIYGKFYNKKWMKEYVRKHVRYAPYLIEFSKVIADEALNGTFNSFHIRMGDYSTRVNSVSSDARRFVRAARKIGFEPDVPVYLATDTKRERYFRPITTNYKTVLRMKDLVNNPVVQKWMKDYNSRVPPTGIRGSLFGLVDQLVCVRSRKFVGTAISTFSKQIVYQRKLLATNLPDLVHNENGDLKIDMTGRADALEWWGFGSSSSKTPKLLL